jgi:hypothetical protein
VRRDEPQRQHRAARFVGGGREGARPRPQQQRVTEQEAAEPDGQDRDEEGGRLSRADAVAVVVVTGPPQREAEERIEPRVDRTGDPARAGSRDHQGAQHAEGGQDDERAAQHRADDPEHLHGTSVPG